MSMVLALAAYILMATLPLAAFAVSALDARVQPFSRIVAGFFSVIFAAPIVALPICFEASGALRGWVQNV